MQLRFWYCFELGQRFYNKLVTTSVRTTTQTMIVAWYDQCFKTRTGDHSVKVLGHWSDRMTIEPGLYKNIYDQKLYYE